jgi:hypothetical protein
MSFIENINDYRNKIFYYFNEILNLNSIAQSISINYHKLITCVPNQQIENIIKIGRGRIKANNCLVIDKF